MAQPTKWETDTNEGHSEWFIERFRNMAAQGVDLEGEARLVDAMVAPGSRILDAGCGTGRVGAALAKRGHHIVGVDADPELIAAANEDHPQGEWITGDLTELEACLGSVDSEAQLFDAIVMAGNVMPFMADETHAQALASMRRYVTGDGFAIIGFGLDRGYSLEAFDRDSSDTGWFIDQRFTTWDVKRWEPDAGFAVTVIRPEP